VRYDEHGWAIDPVAMLPLGQSYSVLSPDAEGRIDSARLEHQAARFFSCTLSLLPAKAYPSGGWPRSDAAQLTLQASDGSHAVVQLVTLPLELAPSAKQQARLAAEAIGGAGMDVLVERAKRLWQLSATAVHGTAAMPLLAAAILASCLLGPILPPEADALFGVRGARERLERLGLRC
jgi:hypothetical protein